MGIKNKPRDSYWTERSKQKDGRSTSKEKICSKAPSFQQSIQANNDEEGSQSFKWKTKIGEKGCGSNNWRFPGEPRSLDDFFLEKQTVLQQMYPLNFSSYTDFLLTEVCTSIIDIGPIRAMGQDFRVRITLPRPKYEFIINFVFRG